MSGLYLNYCFCSLTDSDTDVFSIDYINHEQLSSLRKEYKDICFYRSGNAIYFWSLKNSDNVLAESLSTVKVNINPTEYPSVVSKMLENRIYDLFKTTEAYDLYYEKYSHNLVAKKKSPIYKDDALCVFQCAKVSTYFFRQDDKIHFGFSVSSNLDYCFNWTQRDFANHNIDCGGLFENKSGTVAANTRALTRYKEARGLSHKLDKIKLDAENKAKQFSFTKKVISWLQKGLIGQLYGNIKITNCVNNYFPYDKVFENEIIAAPKKYYANDQVISGLPSVALEKVGPYTAVSNDTVRTITLVASKEYEGTLNVFTKQLATKIKKMFRLDLKYEYSWVEKESVQSFGEAILDLNTKNSDLVILVIKKDYRYMKPALSPYYYCKAKLIGQEVPTQCICIETLKHPNDFILGNISLNIYAKLGGTAWGIEKKDTTKRELIIGIGSTVNYNNQQVISIANVFDNSGVYLAGACNPIVEINNYPEELEKLISQLFETLLLGESDVHLIFHIYKSVGKNREIRALEKVLERYKHINISYAFVHLNYGHNFRVYFNDGKNDLRKGQYIRLNALESLMIVNDKSPIPLKISIDKRSSFKDIYYISQQVFFFSHLSERSFMPSKKPITILYPSIMANLIEKLKIVKKWDYDKLRVKGVTEKLWFL